jgi:hypothetical protein
MLNFKKIGLVFVVYISANVTAESDQLRNDPRRPMDAISRDLGITQEQFVTCFESVHPAKYGDRPTADRVHSNKAVLLGCLHKADGSITNEKLDEIMDR